MKSYDLDFLKIPINQEKRDFVDNSGEDDDFQLAKRYDLTSPFKRFVPGF